MPDPTLSPTRRGPRARTVLIAVAVIAALLVAQGLLTRRHAFAALQARSESAAMPTVATMKPGAGKGQGQLLLPGSLEAPNEANLYARSQGYLKRLHADIGQHVKKGQLLAEIDTPELDEQLRRPRRTWRRAAPTRSWRAQRRIAGRRCWNRSWCRGRPRKRNPPMPGPSGRHSTPSPRTWHA